MNIQYKVRRVGDTRPWKQIETHSMFIADGYTPGQGLVGYLTRDDVREVRWNWEADDPCAVNGTYLCRGHVLDVEFRSSDNRTLTFAFLSNGLVFRAGRDWEPGQLQQLHSLSPAKIAYLKDGYVFALLEQQEDMIQRLINAGYIINYEDNYQGECQ